MKSFKLIPALKCAVIVAAGVLVGTYNNFPVLLTALAVLVFVVASLFLLKYDSLQYTVFILISLALFTIGVLRANMEFFHLPEESIANIPDTKYRSRYELIGVISDLPNYDSDKIRFIMTTERLVTKNDSLPVKGDIMVTIRGNMYKPDELRPLLRAGDRVSLLGRLSDAFGGRNPGEFNYGRYLRLHDIYKTFFVSGYDKIFILSENNLGFFEQNILIPAKIYALNNIDEYLDGDEAAYLKGLVTGERSDIKPEVKEAFINSGVMHVIAVSGLNVAYIIITITLIFTLIRVPSVPRILTTIPILIFYCLFTGARPSIVRATIMGILFLLSIMLERKSNYFNIVGLSALIILVYDPKQLYDPGFVLSYSAVITMVFFYQKFEEHFKTYLTRLDTSGKRYLRYIFVMLLTTFAAQIGTLPISALYFSKISLVSLLANLVVVPLSNIALAIGFFQILSGLFSPYLSSVIAEANNILLTFQLSFVKFFGTLDFAFVDFYGFDVYSIIVYFISLVIIVTASRKNFLFRAIVTVILITSIFITRTDLTDEIEITFIDVGHGNAALIELSDGRTILIDAGTKSATFDSGERIIAPMLKRKGIDKIDLFVISDDKNSTGGVPYLLNKFKTGKVIQGIGNIENQGIENAVTENRITREFVKSGDLIMVDDKTRMYILTPSVKDGITDLSFIFQYGNVKLFFGEGLSKEEESLMAQRYSDFLEADVFKISSHGSSSSSSKDMLITSKPRITVIQAGLNNRFNLPSTETMLKLETLEAEIRRSDEEGAIIIRTDGKDIAYIDWK